MRWSLSEEQAMFQQAFRGWLDHIGAGEARRQWFDRRDHEPFERHLVSGGWLAPGTPVELGGDGGGLLELALAAEELGAAALPSGAWLATVLAVPLLASVPGVATTALRDGAFAALAVPADRPPDRPSGAVRFDPSSSTVSGRIRHVLAADRVAHLVVPVGTGGGTRLYLVDPRGPGVTVRAHPLLDRSRTAGDVQLEAAPARPLDVDAHALLRQASRRAAVLAAADALGAAGRMLDMAVAYSKIREQFGVPVGSFQAVKHSAAMMLVAVESVRSVVYFAASTVDLGQPDAELHAAAAKAQATAAAVRVADDALLVHGAIGFTFEYDLQLFYKRAKLDRELFGPPSTWNERIAAGLPLVSEVRVPELQPEAATA